MADTPALARAAGLDSAMRLPWAEPARRDGISVVMCSTWALTLAAETAWTTPSPDMLTLATHNAAAETARKMPRSSRPAPAEYLGANFRRCHGRLHGAEAK